MLTVSYENTEPPAQSRQRRENGKRMEKRISVEQHVGEVKDDGKVVAIEFHCHCPQKDGKRLDEQKEGCEEKDAGVLVCRLKSGQKAEFVEALLRCASMSDRDSRNAVVNELPDDIKDTIQRNPGNRVDVNNIVNRCMDFEDGIGKLVAALKTFEGPSLAMNGVEAFFEDA